jgi:hypothetical protein
MSVDTDLISTARWTTATLASATTTDIGGQTSPIVTVSGSTGITSLGNHINRLRIVRFTGTPTITHNATTLILPGSANLTVLSGSVHAFASDSSGNWRWLWSNEITTLTTAAGRALLDDASAADQRVTLGVGTTDSPMFTAVNVGHASNNTLASTAAGTLDCEGSRMFQRNNVLGTVSQSGGTPTGALIESGSNANGEYKRFACGLQLCWLKAGPACDASGAVGSVFRTTADVTWTYPATFAAAPVVNAQPSSIGRLGLINNSNTSSCGVRQISFTTSAVTVDTQMTAIGRWF